MPDSLQAALVAYFSPPVWSLIEAVGRVAGEQRVPLFFAGGMVRDLLLNQPGSDLDFVTEGDAIVLARALQQAYGGKLRRHSRFGTATWTPLDMLWRALGVPAADIDPIDFASARTETYRAPAQLPNVAPGRMSDDLARRDFTINSMAIRLDGEHLGTLLDLHGGRVDLAGRRIRVLHDYSFVDDPTRIFRAARFEQRLGFAIEPHTAALLAGGRQWIRFLTGPRVKYELELLLTEAYPETVLARLDELGVWPAVVEGMHWPRAAAASFARLRLLWRAAPWSAALPPTGRTPVYLAVWLFHLASAQREALLQRLQVRRGTQEIVHATAALLETLGGLPAGLPPSEVTARLDRYTAQPGALLAARAVALPPLADYLDLFWTRWRHVRPLLTGRDLRAHNLPPGPRFRRLLDALRAARLDGLLTTRSEEEAWLAALLAAEEEE